MFCRKCGGLNEDQTLYCGSCGTALEKEKAQKKRAPLWWIVPTGLGTAILVGVILWPIVNVNAKKEYKEHVAKAERYLETMDYERAEAEYLKAMRVAPKEAIPYLQLADIYVAKEEPEEAQEVLKEAEAILPKSEQKVVKEKQEEQNDKRLEETEAYAWVVKPTIDADDIYYVKDQSVAETEVNQLNRQFESPYAVIKKGNYLGLIGMDGTINGEVKYAQIDSLAGMYRLAYHADGSVEKTVDEQKYRWDGLKDDTDTIQPYAGFGYTVPLFCCEKGSASLHRIGGALEMVSEPREPEGVMPVKLCQNSDEVCLENWERVPGKFAIYGEEGLITDFIYDQCGSIKDGVLAVEKNGKWGYVDKLGEEVIPFEYESSWQQSAIALSTGVSRLETQYCYAASEGYIPLYKNNQWEVRDTQGKLVIEPGVFESIRPVYEGKCWVKTSGKWGVIEIKKQLEGEESNE